MLQVAINALVLSALYALVAVGFTMIFGIANILNLAHGAAIIVGGFSAFYTVNLLGLNIWASLVLAAVFPALFSVIVYAVFVKPIEDQEIYVIITTLIILLVSEEVFRFLEGSQTQALPPLVAGRGSLFGVSIQYNSLILVAISWVSIVAIFLFINRTWVGQGIKGLSMSPQGSVLVGVNRRNVTIVTFAVAGALAGLAGLFFGMSQGVQWDMGLDPLLIAFSIVILGGLGSIKGSVIGAHIIGTVETLTITYVDGRLTGVSALVILLIIILVRPYGLYGYEGEAE
jgi:branched-chain amino acid transport system permease protein